MKIVALICRILLGLGFAVFGANVLHPFLPVPPMDPSATSTKWSLIMIASGWMKVVGASELVGGLLVLAGGTAPLGLCLLGPLLVNILCFHLLLLGGVGITIGLVFSVLWGVLLYAYRAHFEGIFTTNAATNA